MDKNPRDLEKVITYFGRTTYRGEMIKFGIKTDDRRRHMYIIGKSGTGKTTLIENLVVSDINNGFGVGFVDPHGDSVEKVLDCIPPGRINDVIYFNPSDVEYPIAFNILESVNPEHKHLVASGMMQVFKKIWPDVWSARMEYILNNTILSLLDYPGSTMLGVNRMLSDKEFRKKVVEKLKDPIIKSFWVDEFAKYTDRLAVEATASIQNKVGQFLSASVIRNIIGQVKSTIDMRDIMDNGKILLCNLSKGRIGEDNSGLLGGMIITKLQLAAMERVDIPTEKRKDFILYVDEFQNFANPSFATILSEARKYHLSLVLAHQYIEQLDETVEAAVFGNIGTLIVMRIGATDAEELVKEFTPYFIEEDLVNLQNFHFYIKLMIDGAASKPFSAIGLPPIAVETESEEKIIEVSRERYAVKRDIIEDKIARWISKKDEERKTETERFDRARPSAFRERPPMQRAEREAAPRGQRFEEKIEKRETEEQRAPARRPAPNFVSAVQREEKKAQSENPISPPKGEIKFEVKCSKCGQATYVRFKPDPARPIYCKKCLTEIRNAQIQRTKKEIVAFTPEEMAEGEKEVSLSVLKQPPQGGQREEHRKEEPRPIYTKSAEVKVEKPIAKTPESKPKPKQNSESKIKPGEVVRL